MRISSEVALALILSLSAAFLPSSAGAATSRAAVLLADAGNPQIQVTTAEIQGGRLIVAGTANTVGWAVRIDGTNFVARANSNKNFRFNLLYRTSDCQLTLLTSTGSKTVLIGNCGPGFAYRGDGQRRTPTRSATSSSSQVPVGSPSRPASTSNITPSGGHMLITTTSHVFANITAPQQVKFTTNVRRIVSGSFVNTTAVAGGWSLYQQALTSPAWIATHATVWDTATPGVPMTYAVSAQMSAPAFPGSANEAAYSCYISVTDFQ